MVCLRPESCDVLRALMSITPNLCCDETEPRSIHSPNIYGAVTRGRGQAQQEPNSAKPPMVEAESEENPAQGKCQEAHHAGDQDSEKRTQQKAHAAQPQIPEDLQLRTEEAHSSQHACHR